MFICDGMLFVFLIFVLFILCRRVYICILMFFFDLGFVSKVFIDVGDMFGWLWVCFVVMMDLKVCELIFIFCFVMWFFSVCVILCFNLGIWWSWCFFMKVMVLFLLSVSKVVWFWGLFLFFDSLLSILFVEILYVEVYLKFFFSFCCK